MKPFMLWGIPWYLPSGVVFKFSFYFGDRGGCFFLDPGMGAAGEETFYSEGGLKWLIVMPVAVKFLLPSWLFLLSDAKVNGKSVKPCTFGVCKASVHTGQFSITGPRTPVIKMLEEVSAPKDCTRLDVLPDMSFTLMVGFFFFFLCLLSLLSLCLSCLSVSLSLSLSLVPTFSLFFLFFSLHTHNTHSLLLFLGHRVFPDKKRVRRVR